MKIKGRGSIKRKKKEYPQWRRVNITSLLGDWGKKGQVYSAPNLTFRVQIMKINEMDRTKSHIPLSPPKYNNHVIPRITYDRPI